MTLFAKSPRSAGSDHSAHFEALVSDDSYNDNPLMSEYRLLYDEYSAQKHRAQLLERETNSLKTQLGEMDRSLYLSTRIDPMTGLANRRDIMEKMERELSRSERHQRTFSVLLVDLDNFKKLNEKYGYNDGDDVLVEVARVLMGCVRNEDVCARWGGEEFLFLLAETNTEGAANLARKILDSISMTEFKANRPGIRITASIGLCEYRTGQSIYECVSRAEQALRSAKLGGKNCCEVAG
ncbi:MAG: GGDEF domain-containing protein [Desulfuromonadaceae bacterium]|nr:GGDEF domain-containing protein [Desulfuromonadaceae bacterium]